MELFHSFPKILLKPDLFLYTQWLKINKIKARKREHSIRVGGKSAKYYSKGLLG